MASTQSAKMASSRGVLVRLGAANTFRRTVSSSALVFLRE
jgi:hypothetical protein